MQSINQSNNVKSIADIPQSDVVNQRNSRIAFYNTFADCHDIINIIYNNSYNNSSNTQSLSSYFCSIFSESIYPVFTLAAKASEGSSSI